MRAQARRRTRGRLRPRPWHEEDTSFLICQAGSKLLIETSRQRVVIPLEIREARLHTTDGLLLWLKTAQPGKDEYIRAIRILAGTAYHAVYLGVLR